MQSIFLIFTMKNGMEADIPKGLRGKEIPLAARLFAIIDVWDALSSDRPYRPAWSRESVLEHIRQNSGTHFDPDLVPVFIELLQEYSEK